MSFDITAIFTNIFGTTSAFSLFVWVVAIIVVIVFLRKAWPSITGFVDTINALGALPESLDKLTAMEENLKVLDELRPNHGGSIRDQVTEIMNQTTKTALKLDEHIELCKLVEEVSDTPAKKRVRKAIENIVDES